MVDHLLFGCRVVVLAIMSTRDMRKQIVLDRDLAWFAFLNTLPLLLSPTYPNNSSLPPVIVSQVMNIDEMSAITANQAVSALAPLPLWLAQLLFLALSTGGALFLLFTSFVLKCASLKEMIGKGDVLFTLAAGLGSDYTMSFRMVMLAFVLAMPAALIIKCARRERENIAFIPFLSLAFLCLTLF
ncbi:MAG: hypothetical protein GX991_02100 [Clostridiaceae bacterium]|nr:hypothetical protein [Clostridiaceae bacterium]